MNRREESRGRGRPPKHPIGHRRSKDIIWVNAGKELKERCRKAAKADGRELTQWCRVMLKQACDKAGV
ncbi:MAG: hypothetical protein ACYS21_20465 [Planctomycetota bacterium]|jgi:hypothetical protein